jgi:hypothetical protein
MPQFSFVTLGTCIIVLIILGKNNFRQGWNKVLRTNLNLQNIHPELFTLILGDELLVTVGELLDRTQHF